jgi:Ca-activated chloride channel family protein
MTTDARFAGARACLAILLCAAALADSAIARQEFRAAVDLVRVPVVVLDADGAVVRGLTAADFELREEGEPQPIASFAEGAPGRALPLHAGLLLDTSVSMEDDLSVATTATIKFVNALDEAADVTFVDFDDAVRLGRFSPPSYPQLFERVRQVRAGGGTSLYDALAVYVETSLRRTGQHVVLVHTDGGDSTSSLTFGRLQELLRRGNVIIYVVGYLEHQRSASRLSQQVRLTQIARETGGEAFFPTSAKAIDEAYGRIIAELGARYTIGYVPARTPRTGMGDPDDAEFRRLEVRVTRPDLAGATVRARSGYIAQAPRR